MFLWPGHQKPKVIPKYQYDYDISVISNNSMSSNCQMEFYSAKIAQSLQVTDMKYVSDLKELCSSQPPEINPHNP